GSAIEAINGQVSPVIGHRGETNQTAAHASPGQQHKICGLLPAGQSALSKWPTLWQEGFRTFKWKIGVADIGDELFILKALLKALPAEAQLRLDANGGLTLEQARSWLTECDRLRSAAPTLEYLEQPLPTDQVRSLQALASNFQTPIALDESVASLAELQTWHERQWPGYYVLKPAIMGFPWAIRRACDQVSNPKIFSSVFEASVGQAAALGLAAELSAPNFALGFGVDHWLAESPSVSISSSTFS
ncbi:MAG: o-succinylbenzoate synthase, partial [Cyanobacteria bacterium P01_F01_bin.42]